MAISAKEAGYLNAQSKRSKQDSRAPFLINVNDGRLVPNIMTVDEKTGESFSRILRHNSSYRVYRGDPKATVGERLKYVDAQLGSARAAAGSALSESADVEPFDIGKADKDELILFAQTEYGRSFSPSIDVRTLRKQVAALAAGELE